MAHRQGAPVDTRTSGTTLGVIDTHCHIDQFEAPEVVARLTEQKRIFTIAVTNLPSHYQLACKHLAGFRYVIPALGMHPLAAREHASEIQLFRELIAAVRFVGEVGLDFSANGRSTADLQFAAFDEVIQLAVMPFRIITLHSRGAEREVLDCLKRHRAGPVIFHWFSGSRRMLEEIFAAGHYISLNPAMTSTQKWQKRLSALPRERVLTETDGPFAKAGAKPAQPFNVAQVVGWLADSWGCSPAEVEQTVKQNFDHLLARVNSGR